MKRRKFLRSIGVTGGALIVGFAFEDEINAREPQLLVKDATDYSIEINPFVVIARDGSVTIVNPRPEIGQGAYQAIPALVAEELEVDLNQIRVVQSDGSKKYGSQNASGSSSVEGSWKLLRKAGAAAREMLVQSAAAKWRADASQCYAANGQVFNRVGLSPESFSYGGLVEEAVKLQVPKEPTLKTPDSFKIIGKPGHRNDIPAKINGSAVFGIDIVIPGMVYAVMERPSSIYAKLLNMDASDSLKVPGVLQVIRAKRPMPNMNLETVAVIAQSFYSALQGKKVLKTSWDTTGQDVSTTEYSKRLHELSSSEGVLFKENGNFEEGLKSSITFVEASYQTPFLAHAAMEPCNIVASVKNDSCEIWGSVPVVDKTVSDVSAFLNIPAEKVKVNVTFVGGSFGRKGFTDFILEAVDLSRTLGVPVKSIWTREDDISGGPFRPAMRNVFKAGIDKDGRVSVFHHKAIAGSIRSQWNIYEGLKEDEADDWALEQAPYSFPNTKYSFVHAKTKIPMMWWRATYQSSYFFASESFVDEIAFASGIDPLKFRKEWLTNSPRYVNLLELLEQKSVWHSPLKSDEGKGVAITRFSSICGCVVRLKKTSTGIKISKIIAAVDCGICINPDNVAAQIEGGIIMGLSACIKDQITIENGIVQQSNFHNYRVLRINEIPAIEVHIVSSTADPRGVGETGVSPVAPALTNAVFNLTGRRIRELPFDLADLA